MYFAFYKEGLSAGLLYDWQESIDRWAINPATSKEYTELEIDRLEVLSLYDVLRDMDALKYLAEEYPSVLLKAIKEE